MLWDACLLRASPDFSSASPFLLQCPPGSLNVNMNVAVAFAATAFVQFWSPSCPSKFCFTSHGQRTFYVPLQLSWGGVSLALFSPTHCSPSPALDHSVGSAGYRAVGPVLVLPVVLSCFDVLGPIGSPAL